MLLCPMSDMITNDQSTGHSGLHLRTEDDDDDDVRFLLPVLSNIPLCVQRYYMYLGLYADHLCLK